MKCEKCQIKEANVHLSETRQGQTTEHHFCESCAREMGIGHHISDYMGTIGNLFGSGMLDGSNVFHTTGGIPAFGAQTGRNSACPSCGQTFDDFRRTGLFGCARCYEAFSDRLDPVFRRVQGSVCHVGRKPKLAEDDQETLLLQGKLRDLKKSLKQAVQEEAYEQAAKIRDEIHTLEGRLCNSSSEPDGRDGQQKSKQDGIGTDGKGGGDQ